MNAPLCQTGAKSHTFPHELKNHYALLTEVGDLTYLFRNSDSIWTWILKYGPEGGSIESFRLPFVSEASEGRSDELGRNYLSWDTWEKIVVKKYLFFAKLQPVEVGGEAKIHWFWLILVYFYQRNYKRKSTTPTSTPQISELASRNFFEFFFGQRFRYLF